MRANRLLDQVMFQSTPVIADGRTTAIRASITRADLFQSTPVIADGRTVSMLIVDVMA